jgi:hypothetical protein
MKLGEANRLTTRNLSPKPISRQYSSVEEANDGQHVGLSDDEGSLVSPPPSKSPACGACRTRESKVWWKAPKGLATDILCDSCGTSWRKYADLNVRPVREESLPASKTRVPEKREGTPLSGPSSKRARVSTRAGFKALILKLLSDLCLCTAHSSARYYYRPADPMPCLYENWTNREGIEVQNLPIQNPYR